MLSKDHYARVPRALLGLALVAALALAAACGGGGSAETPSPSPTATQGGSTPGTTPPAASPTGQATAAPSPTEAGTATPTTGSATPPAADSGMYLDDRSTPDALILSYYNAINRKEYARAYSYFETAAASSQVPAFAAFQQGYADTASVQVTLGPIGGDAGAGQLYYTVPVVLDAQMTDGTTQTFSGCYTLHLGRPEIQSAPPFHPLAIQSASVQSVPSGGSTSDLLADACRSQGTPPAPPVTPTPTTAPTDVSSARYLDSRSTAEDVVRSFYNAINRKEYARAYDYWEPDAATSHLRPFPEFQQGYAQTASVALTTGDVRTGAAAGNLYYSVPVALVATQTDGSTQTYVGCYQLHLGQPANQAEPPFKPMGIQDATIQQVDNGADTARMMTQACQ